jgi:hypothetical protein
VGQHSTGVDSAAGVIESLCIERIACAQYLLVSRACAAVAFRLMFRCEVDRLRLGHHHSGQRA